MDSKKQFLFKKKKIFIYQLNFMTTYTGRIVLIGETQVGKTSIISKYLRGQSSMEQKSTIGAVFHTHVIDTNGVKLSLQIWDTAGQERYKALGPIYYRKSHVGIAVFDLTRKETMKLLESWIKTFRENADDTYVIVAANKCDLDSKCEFTLDETMEWAQSMEAECIWTSAQSGIGINDLFSQISKHLINKFSQEIPINNSSISIESTKKEEGCSC